MPSGASSSLLEKPVQLIAWDAQNECFQLAASDEAVNALQQLPRPVRTIGVMGVLRSGKSFLMNSFYWYPESPYERGKTGFALGSQVRSVTKGIWVWAKPLPGDLGSLLLLDTEGLYDPENSDPSYDVRVIAMTMALSSTLAFNVRSTVEAASLETLALATALFERAFTTAVTSDVVATFPRLYYVVRDFFLQLPQGTTPDDWLECVLSARSWDSLGGAAADADDDDEEDGGGGGETGTTSSSGRAADFSIIKRAFPQGRRGLVTLPRPNASVINRLEEAPADEVCSGFRTALYAACTRLRDTDLDPLPAGSRMRRAGTETTPNLTTVNGSEFLVSVRHAVDVINSNKINVETVLEAIAAAARERARIASEEAFEAVIDQALVLPCGAATVAATLRQARDAAREALDAEVADGTGGSDTGAFLQASAAHMELEAYIERRKTELMEKNAIATAEAAQDRLGGLEDKLLDAADAGDVEALATILDTIGQRAARLVDGAGDEAVCRRLIDDLRRRGLHLLAETAEAERRKIEASGGSDRAAIDRIDALEAAAARARQLEIAVAHDAALQERREQETKLRDQFNVRRDRCNVLFEEERSAEVEKLAAARSAAERRQADLQRRLAQLSAVQETRRSAVRNETLTIVLDSQKAAADLAAIEQADILAITAALDDRPQKIVYA